MSNYSSNTKLCMIFGDPVAHSLSPQMHNAGYKALAIEQEYVYLAAQVAPINLKDAVTAIRTLGIRGVSCTIPHKEAVMEHLDSINPCAKEIGAVNTIVNNNGTLIGYNTDWIGINRALEKAARPDTATTENSNSPLLQNKTTLVIGAGGSARAAIYALKEMGASIQVVNRSNERLEALTERYKVEPFTYSNAARLRPPEVVISTVPPSAWEDQQLISIILPLLKPAKYIFDINYFGGTTLEGFATTHSINFIPAVEMLIYQGLEQFRLYVGKEVPETAFRSALNPLSKSKESKQGLENEG